MCAKTNHLFPHPVCSTRAVETKYLARHRCRRRRRRHSFSCQLICIWNNFHYGILNVVSRAVSTAVAVCVCVCMCGLYKHQGECRELIPTNATAKDI